MNAHASAEVLSAYLDGELARSERQQLEGHLESCGECLEGLEQLRSVVSSLGRLQGVAPPATFSEAVRAGVRAERLPGDLRKRAALLADRAFGAQSFVGLGLALVIALVAIAYLFAYGLESRAGGNASELSPSRVIQSGRGLGDRTFEWRGGVWVEMGKPQAPADRVVRLSNSADRRWIEGRLQLERFSSLTPVVRVWVDGEWVEIHFDANL